MHKKLEEMSREEAAVAIAEDVLKHLDAMDITQQTYVSGVFPVDTATLTKDTQLQTVQDEILRNCGVCALGACFLSHIRLFDNITLNDIGYGNLPAYIVDDSELELDVGFRPVFDTLAQYFDKDNLALIETAFECSAGFWDGEVPKGEAAELFGRAYRKPKDRVRAIMENIIKNRGMFVIPDHYMDEAIEQYDRKGKDANAI